MDINFFDPNYLPWLIPVPPLISFLLIIMVVGRSKTVSHVVAVTSVLLSWIMSWAMFFQGAFATEGFGLAAYNSQVDWMSLGTGEAFKMGVLVDPLTAVMLFMVPMAIVMIFIYAIGYMSAYPQDDPHQLRHTRFFAYLSLFAGAMLTLVVADNLLLLFMGWEVMGLCSYLLIGFLFEKKSAYQAAVKAFMTTRVADVLMLVGIGYLYATTGTLSFREIMYNEATLELLRTTTAPLPLVTISAASLIGLLLVIGTIGKSAQFPLHIWLPDAMEGPTPVSAMIHAAAMVSAGVYMLIRMYPLISATADPHHGDYNAPLILMGLVGSFTALFAAVLGVGQTDVKRVLAYSTISQLGFMVAALGIGAYVAAVFHLITHAFFKALLFMSSGAVIHAMEHGEHHAHEHHGHGHDHDHGNAHGLELTDEHGHVHHAADAHGHSHEEDAFLGGENPQAHDVEHGHGHGHGSPTAVQGAYGYMHAFEGEPLPEWNEKMVPDGLVPNAVADPNDMRNMGGLLERIPVTAICFLIGGLSLAGFPLITAGFWSKDEILADALLVGTGDLSFDNFYWLHIVVFISLVIAATFTAFYTGRQWILTFLGTPRSEAAKYATLMSGGVNDEVLSRAPWYLRWREVLNNPDAVTPELRNKSAVQKFLTVYRDSFPMQLPLVILSFFALTAGFVGIHADFPVLRWFTGGNNYFHNFLHAVILELPEAPEFSWVPVLFSFAAALGGLTLAWLVYGGFGREVTVKTADQLDPVEARIGAEAWLALQNRFYLDNMVLRALYIPFEAFGRFFTYRAVDKNFIDELLNEIASFFTSLGEAIKRFNYVVIDGVGDGIPQLIGHFGSWFRNLQTGRVQQYMLFIAIAVLAMGTLLMAQVL